MADSFKDVIEQHLHLKRRNSHLEAALPLENYQPEPASFSYQTPAVFDAEAEAEGAAFNTTEWNSNPWSETRGDRSRRTAETSLESLEKEPNSLDFDWNKRF